VCERDHELSGTKNLERVVVAYSKVISNHSAGKTEKIRKLFSPILKHISVSHEIMKVSK
jgi:hypothetical protein